MKKDFFKDPKIKFPAYEPWISSDDQKIVKKALKITADLCIYTNDNITILKA